MSGLRPEQGRLTRDNDLSKTNQTRQTIASMIDGLNDLLYDDLSRFFAPDFRWIGNAGCGIKYGIEEFKRNWVLPFRAAFNDKTVVDEARLAEGEWMAAFGHISATHCGDFMGVSPTGKRVEIRYMDIWRVQNGKITDNWVMVDFASVLQQLGIDVFRGYGWEKLDSAGRPDYLADASPASATKPR